jgi:hypothetical protein
MSEDTLHHVIRWNVEKAGGELQGGTSGEQEMPESLPSALLLLVVIST